MYLDRLTARVSGGFLLAEGDPGAAGAGGGEQGGGIPSADRTLMQGGSEAGDQSATADTGAAPAWPDNWREIAAGDDKKALAQLQRLATPADYFKSYRELQTKMSSRPAFPTLAEGATEEEVDAYRKAIGVPDTPEGYDVAFPEGVVGDTDFLDAMKAGAHAAHVPPAHFKAMFSAYLKQADVMQAARAEQLHEMTLEQAAEMRKEFPGREFVRHFGDRSRGSVGLVGEFLSQHFDGEEAQKALDEVLNARLSSGLKVGDYAPFLKGMAAMARAYSDDEALIGGDGAGGGQSIDQEYKALIQESVKNPREFNANAAKVARLNELAGARTRRDERGRFVAAA